MAKPIPWMYAAILAAFSLSANAAQLGKLTVTSALGQPLRAEIGLVTEQANELNSLTARMASAEDFQRAGIERNSALLDVRFSIEQRKKGKPVLKLSTAKPFNEPFMDLLVELHWASGRLLREYTVLLDPPGHVEHQAIQPVAIPAIDSPSPVVAPVETAANAPQAKTEEAKPEIAPAASPDPEHAATDAPPAAPQPISGDEEKRYTVRKGDTLASIASKLKPQGQSLDQMLVALYQTNKHAFAGNNMNRLKSGQILRVPEQQQVAATGQAEAAQEVKMQTADWNAYRQRLAGAVAEAPSTQGDAPTRVAQGKITAEVQDQGAPPTAPTQDVLRVSKSEAAANAKEAQALQNRISSLQEEATARSKAIDEAGERIATLEKSVKDMEHLLELKNKSLAEIQNKVGVENPAENVAAPPAPAVEAPKPAVEKPAEVRKPQPPVSKSVPRESSNKTGYFVAGIVIVLLLGGGIILLLNRQRRASLYTGQNLTELGQATA